MESEAWSLFQERIAELRAELKELQATPKSDWHTAFEALLRFSTHKYKGVTIQTEVEIGADAPRTDYLILTDDETQEFEETISRYSEESISSSTKIPTTH